MSGCWNASKTRVVVGLDFRMCDLFSHSIIICFS